MKKRSLKATAMFLAAVTLLTACGAPGGQAVESGAVNASGGTQGAADGGGSQASAGEMVNIEFWSAPQVAQQAFWESMASQYKAVNPNVNVTVSAMPESPSSEAGIQSAIASGQ